MSKRIIVFILLNMLLVAASLGVGFHVYRASGRYFARDVVYIAPRLNERHLHFSMTDIDLLTRMYPGHAFAAVNRGSARIAASTHEAVATVIYTDGFYFGIHALDFIEGGQAAEGLNAIVINQALAWRLFGNTDNIVGLTVWIGDSPYIVTGVVWQDHEDRFTAWMTRPAGITGYATALYIQPNIPDPLTINQAREMLTHNLRQRLDDYAIVDINRYVESMGIRHQMLLYILWACVMIFFVRIAWRRVKNLDKKSTGSIVGVLLPVLATAICMYILTGVNDILLWLPNLSDPHISVFESISTVGMLPPDGYLPYGLSRLSTLSRYANYAFIAGVIGLVSLLFCLNFHERQTS